MDARVILIGIWLTMGNLITMAYKSNLLASMALVTYEKPINTMEDVVISGLPVMTIKGTLLARALEFSPSPLQRDIYEKQSAGKGWAIGYKERLKRNAEIDSLVKEGRLLAALGSRTMNKKRFARLVKETYFNTHTSWIFPKNSRLRERIVNYLQRLRDTGIHQKLQEHYFLKEEIPFVMNPNNFRYLDFAKVKKAAPIEFRQIYASVGLLAIVYFISFFLLFLELLSSTCRKTVKYFDID